MSQAPKPVVGYLPDERPPIWKLILFALQQILVMFPATVLVALLTGFHVSTTIFASGLATICFSARHPRQDTPLLWFQLFLHYRHRLDHRRHLRPDRC